VALSKFLGASVFCVGLVLVIIPGSELFTGNILMAAGVADRKVKLARVLRNWVCVYAGNFIGALLLAFAMFGTGLLGSPDAPSTLGEKAAAIAVAKIDLGFLQALLRGVLCNILVCLAVVLAISSHTIVGKILGIYFPIMVFVLSGFEHSVANMYFIPAGLLVKGSLFASFGLIWQNLVPVTIGNIIGGLLVIMLHPARVKQIARAIRE